MNDEYEIGCIIWNCVVLGYYNIILNNNIIMSPLNGWTSAGATNIIPLYTID